MSVTPTPALTQSGVLAHVAMSTANTNRTDTGTFSSAIPIDANGWLIDYIRFQAHVTTAAGTLRIFYADDGSTYALYAEVASLGVTANGTTPAESKVWIPDGGRPLNPPVGAKLKFCPNNSEAWEVYVHGGKL